ncbi:GHKL domain-containing protein [Streptococcus catagoni]|uniref:GHKL domain-containing protein n=1 Tax=Streptococcus catagoni TaxID=2654874 RepID=UPI00140826C3|nr:GHKL domain-containing protein [Streptococcus catagoni]
MELFGFVCFSLSIIIYYWSEIRIFSFLSDVRLPIWKKFFIISAAIFLNQVHFLTPLLIDPFLFLLVLGLEKRKLFSIQSFFLAFLPSVFMDLFSRFLMTSIIPFLAPSHYINLNTAVLNILAYLFVYPCFALMNYMVGKEYKLIFSSGPTQRATNFYTIFSIFIITYYVDIFLILGFDDPFLHFLHYNEPADTVASYRSLFLVLNFLFLFLFSYFNRKSKAYLESELKKEQEDYITNLELYGNHLEQLYKDVKLFQEGYVKCLNHLGETIEKGDIKGIQSLYNQIVEKSNIYWDDKHYNISKLSVIGISPIKSLLSAKIIEAEKVGIETMVEVPDTISESLIPELDLVLLLSIFCDNAIEACSELENPKIALAYFLLEGKHVFVVTNSTKEEKINISKIFTEGYSSKGDARGIGLSNARLILQKYSQVTLQTKSENYTFSQTLTISPSKGV